MVHPGPAADISLRFTIYHERERERRTPTSIRRRGTPIIFVLNYL